MTSKQCAAFCGCSVRSLYNLRERFPDEVPKTFEDGPGWKRVYDAKKLVPGRKKHAARSSVDLRSDHERYVHFRANRTQSLAEADALKVAITQRNVIDTSEVEAQFSMIASRVRARLHRMCNDLSSALLGLSEAAIYKVVSEKMEHACRDLHLSDDFLEPRKGRE